MVAVLHRFVFVDVGCCHAGATGFQCRHQCARLNQFGTRGVDQQRRRFHSREIRRFHQAARVLRQPCHHHQHVGLREQVVLACGDFVAGSFCGIQ
jgi:hypothetical protein